MRFQLDNSEEYFDCYSQGNSIVLVRDKNKKEIKESFSILEPMDSILPGPVWRGRDSDGNPFHFLSRGNKFFLHYLGQHFHLKIQERNLDGAISLSKEIRSPMPGKILKIFKKQGESFKKGETLGILEAMKMENQLKAGFNGSVSKIFKNEGDLVNQDEVLMELEPLEEL